MIVLTLIIRGTFELLCRVGSSDGDWKIVFSPGEERMVMAVCLAQAADLVRDHGNLTWPARCLLGILGGCLLMACMTDLREQVVYRFVWWVGGAASGLLLLLRFARGGWPGWIFFAADMMVLALYILTQQGLFGKMYGRADCHAFCVCAAAQTGLGRGFQDYVLHMAVAFLGLVLIQGVRKNIASDGNLKKPVPFMPYIALSFWLWVDFAAGKWYI